MSGHGQVRRLALVGTKGAVARCRDFTRTALVDWQWLPAADDERQAAADDILLLVSELATNACLHAGGPQELALDLDEERLRIELTDRSPDLPHPRAPGSAAAPGGHGLRVVERLSRSWGSVTRENGKTVWLEVSVPPRGRSAAGPGRPGLTSPVTILPDR